MQPLHYSIHTPAKINLGLFIKGKRPDGYHEIETVMIPAPIYDEIIFTTKPKPSPPNLNISGIDLEGEVSDNLVLKAWNALLSYTSFPQVFDIHLKKNIPVGAGLGGGSSNAAGVLLFLNRHFALNLPLQDLHTIAAGLGSDVPFFLYGRPMLATGRGEQLTPINLSTQFEIKITKPNIHISTKIAYQLLDLSKCSVTKDLLSVINQPIESWKRNLVNDFEAPIFSKYPEIAEIKAKFYADGAIYAALSGSGSSVYGLFQHKSF